MFFSDCKIVTNENWAYDEQQIRKIRSIFQRIFFDNSWVKIKRFEILSNFKEKVLFILRRKCIRCESLLKEYLGELVTCKY